MKTPVLRDERSCGVGAHLSSEVRARTGLGSGHPRVGQPRPGLPRALRVLLASLALILPSAIGCKQSTGGSAGAKAGADPLTTWSRTYGGAGSDRVRASITTNDNGFLLAGTTDSFGAGGDDLWVTRLDQTGEVTWSRTYGSGGLDFFEIFGVATTEDGGSFVAGTVLAENRATDAAVARLDADGEVLWIRTLGTDQIEIAYSVVAAPGGGCVAVGTRSSTTTDFDALAFRLEADGTVAWEHLFARGPGIDVLRSVIHAPDGRFVAAGWRTPEHQELHDAWVVAFDFSGRVELDQLYFTLDDGSEQPTLLKAIVPTTGDQDEDGEPDPGFIAVGQRRLFDPTEEAFDPTPDDIDVAPIVLRLDLDLEWVRGYSTRYDSDNHADDVVESRDGHAIVVGTSCGFAGDERNCVQFYQRYYNDFTRATELIQIGAQSEQTAYAALGKRPRRGHHGGALAFPHRWRTRKLDLLATALPDVPESRRHRDLSGGGVSSARRYRPDGA